LSQFKSCNSKPCQKAGKHLYIHDLPDKILLAFHPEIFQFKHHLIPKLFVKNHSLYVSACTRCDLNFWREMGSSKSKRGKVNLTKQYQEKTIKFSPFYIQKKKRIQTHSFTRVSERWWKCIVVDLLTTSLILC